MTARPRYLSDGRPNDRRAPAEGDRVMVYGRPITREEEEGFGTIVRVVRTVGTWEGVDYYHCRVLLDGDTERGGVYRTVAAVIR